MSNWKKTDQPCPCGEGTSSYAIDKDDIGFCFKCSKRFPPDGKTNNGSSPEVSDSSHFEYLPQWSISRETFQFFDCKTKVDAEGRPIEIHFPFGPRRHVVRKLDAKEFRTVGSVSEGELFGQSKFPSGSSKFITVCEGAKDAAAHWEMLHMPVVAVSSSSSAGKECTLQRDYLNSFERIYLAFDNDEPGKRAMQSVARLFDFNKIFHVNITGLNDVHDFLENGQRDEYRRVWWNSKKFMPEGIISSFSDIRNILSAAKKKTAIPVPFPTLQEMTRGIRTGESYLFKAPKGVGKSEVFRAILANSLRDTDTNIAAIFLEEAKDVFIKRMAGYQLGQLSHLEDAGISDDQIMDAYSRLVKRDERLHLYGHFGSRDPDIILDRIRFMATAAECRYIFFDHITMAVTGLMEQDERRALDYISTQLEMMVKNLDFALLMISHQNAQGGSRGSANIDNVADTIICMDRDVRNPDEFQRNLIRLEIEKNRHVGPTGPAGILHWDRETSSMREITEGLPT